MNTELQPIFLTLEGMEAAGKSTLGRKLKAWFEDQDREVILVGEPGGTEYGVGARQLFLQHFDNLTPQAEVGLLLTAKSQLLETIIRPALARGAVVICDRYTDTLYAYQHHGKGYPREMIETMIQAFGVDFKPDLTLMLHLPAEISMERSQARKAQGGEFNVVDAKDLAFHNTISLGLMMEQRRRSRDSWKIIDATQSIDEVFTHAVEVIVHWMENHNHPDPAL